MKIRFAVQGSARVALLAVACVSAACLVGCARQEGNQGGAAAAALEPTIQAAQAEARPASPVPQRFTSAAVPEFEPGKVKVTLLASKSATLKPRGVAPQLLEPQDLAYDSKGVLYAVASRQPPANPDAGLNTDLIVAITPDAKARVFAESGIQGYAQTDHGKVANYNGFSDLGVGPDGMLLALRNGVYPVSVGAEGVVGFIPFKLPDGTSIRTVGDWDSTAAIKNWHVVGFGSNAGGRIVMAIENPASIWYEWTPGGTLEEIKNRDDLPPNAVLNQEHVAGQLGPDGYAYYVDTGSASSHATLMRVGDPGRSILNANATRTVITELNIKNPTGYLAFGPSHQLAVSGEDGIYLVEPVP